MNEKPPTPDEDKAPDAGLWRIIENLTALLESMQDWRPYWALRERLPNRRESETLDMHFGGRRFHVTIGRFPDGRVGEIFVHGYKAGTDMDLLCDDLGVVLSRLLQHGDTPDALAAGLGKLGGDLGPSSLCGAIAALLVERTGTKGRT